MFGFSRGERRGVVLLLAAILLVFLLGHFYLRSRQPQEPDPTLLQRQAESVAQTEAFLATVKERERSYAERRTSYNDRRRDDPVPVLAPFDPNRADSVELCRLGLPRWMASNLLRYRKRGGVFRKAEDFRKLYGLTEEQYQALLPYIRITPAEEKPVTDTVSLYRPRVVTDTVPSKYPEGTLVDLNLADTTELKRIPGVGSTIARMVVEYRERLGGYYQVEQLAELRLDHERLRPWFLVDTTRIHRLPINRLGVERLRRHPYLNFYQAKALVDYRRKRGDLHSLKPLSLLEEFTPADLERLSHYVSFE